MVICIDLVVIKTKHASISDIDEKAHFDVECVNEFAILKLKWNAI